ncbi:MAG: 3'-5' exonuclease [Planctomycetota bacterium]
MQRPLVFLDTESATLHGPPHLIELAAVRVVDGDAVDRFAELVRPEVPVDEGTSAIHGLTIDDLRGADGAAVVLARFLAWLDPEDWLVAHNMPADANVLGFELARAGLVPPRNPLFDTLKLTRRGLRDAPDHKLATLVEYLGLDVDTTHRALADAVACWQVFEAALRLLLEEEAETAAESAREPTEATILRHAAISGTLDQYLPAPPSRQRAAVRRLERARRDACVVTLVYGEETARPAELAVLPRLLFRREKRGYLEGECQSSGILKTYRLDRIHRIHEAR